MSPVDGPVEALLPLAHMRQWIAITFLGLFISTNTEVHQLLKVPVLFQHFDEHQADGPMGWWDFLEQHYGHGHHRHAGTDKHHGLPFHCDHHCATQTLLAQIAEQPATTLVQPCSRGVHLIATEDRIPPREGPGGIWQPPRA